MRVWSLLVLSLCLAGCAAAAAGPTVSDFDLAEYRATVALSASQLDRPDGPGPAKPLRKDCKVCNGTGKVRSGDGLHVFDCTNCVAPTAAVILPETPESSGSEEVAFGGEQRTLRSDPLCPCDLTGLCTCAECACATKRTRVAYLYCTTPCPGCDAAKAAVEAAARSGRLPSDLRVVVRANRGDAPEWVKRFPTFHFEFAGRWYETTKPDVFLRECNGIVATTPVYSTTTTICGPAGCSVGSCASGSCFSGGSFGGCSSGSCGGGASFGRGFFGGGFRSGGGCSSCR